MTGPFWRPAVLQNSTLLLLRCFATVDVIGRSTMTRLFAPVHLLPLPASFRVRHLSRITLLATALCAMVFCHSSQAQEGFRPLFNGKDLADWDGNPELWSVKDGCINGQTTGP